MNTLAYSATVVALRPGGRWLAGLGSLIRSLRDARGLTQGQLAAYAHVGRPWLSRVEVDDIDRPDPDMLRKLAPVLRVAAETLLAAAGYDVAPQPLRDVRSLEEIAAELQSAIRREREISLGGGLGITGQLETVVHRAADHYEVLPGDVVMVPLVESLTAAGEGAVAGVEYWPYHLQPGEVDHKQRFAVLVKGDCLSPRVQNGDVAVIDKLAVPKDTDVVAVQIDGESLLRIIHGAELVALNSHPPIPLSERVHVEGLVVSVSRRP